ncbi:MAG: PDZ domain-containing protein [Candidatus Bathyarchaeota archaeon]|nr:PDZ domain-containing protein [Candidatus Bathyarchaeota archaeon]
MKPWLGVIGLSVNEDVAKYYELPTKQGVLVTRAVEQSPAQRSGITVGDIITRMDGAPIRHVEDLAREIHLREVGDKVELTVIRRGREQVIAVVLSEMP